MIKTTVIVLAKNVPQLLSNFIGPMTKKIKDANRAALILRDSFRLTRTALFKYNYTSPPKVNCQILLNGE
jgi:hypothetical protein